VSFIKEAHSEAPATESAATTEDTKLPEPEKEEASKTAEPEPVEPLTGVEDEAEPQTEPEKTEAPPQTTEQPESSQGKTILVKGSIVVRELAEQLGVKPNQLVADLMRLNVFASINEKLEISTVQKIAEKYGYTIDQEKKASEHRKEPVLGFGEDEEDDRPEDLEPRSPVVTFLGHVDHGKTSLLDRIRNAAVAKGEFGGITQHIGAYTIDAPGGRITFLDTPGHAAFTAMRARGANLTDIAVIVIAADDGIMPQTKEAIMHARAAGVAIIVAINKIDLPGVDTMRVMQQLQGEDLAPEDWGGETICCRVSAETGEGMDHLLEMILLQSEMLELKGNPKRNARGYVIEALLEPGMGPTANLLITNGTLKVGDAIVCGAFWGRVRALIDDHGSKLRAAGPSTPVKCLGLSGVPEAGAEFRALTNDKKARGMAEQEQARIKNRQLTEPKKASLENIFAQLDEQDAQELKVIVKADTQGSVEAIVHSLNEINSDKVNLSFALAGTGNITNNDVMLASASNAVILGFHVAKDAGAEATAKHEGVEIQLHQVIYELIDTVKEAMTGLLKPLVEQVIMGSAEIKQVFNIGNAGKIAGCIVLKGIVRPRLRARVTRNNELIYDGTVQTLKHFQQEVPEVREAQECGIRLEKFADLEEGDLLEFYDLHEVQQTL